MARGNQREKAREKNLKAQAGQVRFFPFPPFVCTLHAVHATDIFYFLFHSTGQKRKQAST